MRVLALLATATIAVVGLQSPASAAAADMDCGNFGSQKAAQIFFLNNNPAADPHNLDADGDWVVCESNPGPYYYGRDPSPDSNPTPAPVPVKAAPAPLKVVKVVAGDLVRLRQGSAKPFDVRLIGLKIPGESCMTNGARRFLKDVAKPGRIVTVIKDTKSPQRDRQGNMVAEVRPKNGNAKSGFSNKVVTNGWAKVQSYKFGAKRTYLDLMDKADHDRVGLFDECIENYGSSRYPYEVGTTFEVDGWRYTFGATDFDALPEMTAEKAAAAPGSYTFTPPKPGATFRRVPVTATRLDSSPRAAFGYVYGDTIEETTIPKYGSCGTAPNLLDQMAVAAGQTVSGYLCTAKPAADGFTDEMWAIADPKSYYVLRYIVAQ